MPMSRSYIGTERRAAPSKSAAPSSVITPLSGVSSPAIERSVVVLPHPDGPSSVNNSPLATSKDTSKAPPAGSPERVS